MGHVGSGVVVEIFSFSSLSAALTAADFARAAAETSHRKFTDRDNCCVDLCFESDQHLEGLYKQLQNSNRVHETAQDDCRKRSGG